jgi:tetratricopeptide (TPR) repeat protein
VKDESAGVPSGDGDHWRERAAGLRQQGRLAEAAAACRRALEFAPGNALAWSELAHALRLDGKLDEARGAALRAIELAPRLASAWFNLGAVQLAQGEVAQSIEANRRAVELKPDFAEAWSNLGGALAATRDGAGEIDAYRHALDIDPRLAPVWSNLGNALRESGQLAEAVAACRRAVELDPEFAPAWNNLGNALLEGGQHDAAIGACQSALQLTPGLAEAWSTLGGALVATRRYDEAISAHRKAVELQPRNAQVHYSLGVSLEHCGHLAEAIACFRRALDIDPDHADAHFDLGFVLLRTGELRQGWEEYEWRWRRRGAVTRRYDLLALWNGDVSRPGRLLLWGDQGIGDQIIYASMVGDLVRSPLDVALEVDPRLVTLYRRSFPTLSVSAQQKPPPANPGDYDFHLPLGSLGRWLRPSLGSFPRSQGYLKADPARAEGYRKQLHGGPARPAAVIGISWKSANKELARLKSIDLQNWLGILRTPACTFVDLQYGDTAGEREAVEQQGGVRIQHLPDLDLYADLDGLAALCEACDLVITASNVTAHMAGALGRPVWLVLPKDNGRLWYWFRDRSDSPWYPSLRIFAQRAQGDWGETLEEVAAELSAFTSRTR